MNVRQKNGWQIPDKSRAFLVTLARIGNECYDEGRPVTPVRVSQSLGTSMALHLWTIQWGKGGREVKQGWDFPVWKLLWICPISTARISSRSSTTSDTRPIRHHRIEYVHISNKRSNATQNVYSLAVWKVFEWCLRRVEPWNQNWTTIFTLFLCGSRRFRRKHNYDWSHVLIRTNDQNHETYEAH